MLVSSAPLLAWLRSRLLPGDDRGDVPGWVLITLMTAGIVAVLWGVAGADLQHIFHNSVCNVTGGSGGAGASCGGK